MTLRLEVMHKPSIVDAYGAKLKHRLARDLSLHVADVRVVDIYLIDKPLAPAELERVRTTIFTDPITQESAAHVLLPEPFDWAVEVGFLPGVTDNAGRTSREAISDLLGAAFADDEAVYTAKRVLIRGTLTAEDAQRVAGLLSNPLIHRVRVVPRAEAKAEESAWLQAPRVTLAANTRVDTVNLELPDAELAQLGSQGIPDTREDGTPFRRGPLALDLPSLNVIRDYFRKEGRQPTDVELECLAQTWSEHCKHTIFAARLDDVNGLFKAVIQAVTKAVRAKKGANDTCVSVFSDNSGVVRFTEDWDICYKVETHNSPSALDPYGGAITGIVGVNRDPLGTGLGAKLVTNMYGFCFANPFHTEPMPYRRKGRENPILHPRVIFEGVREGVEHGGNKSGIPTSWGFLTFDDRYMGKPLVFVGTLGLMPHLLRGTSSSEKAAAAGDWIVMAGGRVGADGIHGATFSSESLHAGSPTGAVQIGDPITQKKLGDAQLEARDLGLYRSVTDNGAGGLSCSVCEMARECGGCDVELDRVPIKYVGLAPNEIWISESQERMTYAIAPEKLDAFLGLMKRRGVEATVIGRFTDSGRARVTFAGRPVMDIDLDFLHDGLPQKTLASAPYTPVRGAAPVSPAAFATDLPAMLARLNICNKEYVARQYDHEVQGGSVVKPLVGAHLNIHSDATVVRPALTERAGVALSSALFPSYGDHDAYAMSACAIDQAFRNVVAVGADPARVALLDNFCWCSSYDPFRLAQLKAAAQACYDLGLAYELPFISGKDSMFNDFKGYDGQDKPVAISVPPTLLISSIGVVPDARRAQTLDFKAAGDRVWVIGLTREELGGSEYAAMRGEAENGAVPQVHSDETLAAVRVVTQALERGLLASIGSVGLGGLGVALSKAVMAAQLGAHLDLAALPVEGDLTATGAWFSETPGRFLVSVAPENVAALKVLCGAVAAAEIGVVAEAPALEAAFGAEKLHVSLSDLERAYTETLNW